MSKIVVAILLGLGIGLLALGLIMGGARSFSAACAPWLVGALGLMAAGLWGDHQASDWLRAVRVRRAKHTDLAEALTQQLHGNYTPYVIEAAEKLGEARDITAVPDLIYVLERCVDAQAPGWREKSEALANALAAIGDSRALPLLYHLENVRGIGLIPAIRNAIAVIEPRASLLRPGEADSDCGHTLLKPAQSGESEPQSLLRAVEAEVAQTTAICNLVKDESENRVSV